MSDELPIAARLARSVLARDGTVPKSPLLGSAVRAALLADLALAGGLSSSDDGIQLDTTPTGYLPADALLADVVRHPDRSTEWWLRRGPDAVHALCDDLVSRNVWSRRRATFGNRYTERDPSGVHADAKRVRAAVSGRADASSTAVLAAFFQVVGSDSQPGGQRPSSALLQACEPASWLMTDIVDYLLRRRALLAAAANEARAALMVNFIP